MRPAIGAAWIAAALVVAHVASAATPLEQLQIEVRRSAGIMAYRVVADTSVHMAPRKFFPPEREVVSAAIEGDLRERWLALLSSGFEAGSDCAPACVRCADRVRYRLQFPPLADSFVVSILWDDHRVQWFHEGRLAAHRWLTKNDTAWVNLLQATFPEDSVTQTLRATDPGPIPAVPDPGETIFADEMPEATLTFDPHYPPGPLMRGEGGTVRVLALVGPKGRVLETRIDGRHSEFDDPAMVAAQGWRFRPARCGGKPIAVWVVIPFRFSSR